MAPMEEDPDMWAWLARLLGPWVASLAPFKALVVPVVLGALIGQAARGKVRLFSLNGLRILVYSVAIGVSFTPLCAYVSGIPDEVMTSFAVFVGAYGVKMLDKMQKKLTGSEPWDGVERRKTPERREEE